METRKITVFSTQGANKKVFESAATTWGDFSNEISSSYNLKSLAATENINRTDLVNSQAALPTGDFTIFLRPIKTKSGVYGYKEARNLLTEDDKKWLKDTYGKNWTQATTDQLNEALSRKTSSKKSEKVPSKDSAKKKVEEADVKEVNNSSETNNSEEIKVLLTEVTDFISAIEDSLDVEDYGLKHDFDNCKKAVERLKVIILGSAKPEKVKEISEEEKLAQEWAEIQKGF